MKHDPLALMCGLTCLLALPGTSKAATNFVKNGSFETNGGLGQIAPANKAGQPGFPNISLSEWTKIDERNDGSQGFPSVFSPPTIKVWGPPNNTFPVGSDMTVGPDGAFWVGIDGDYGRSSLDQPITDLIAGTEYELSFVWAGSQFTDQTLATKQWWTYSLDGTTFQTSTITNPDKGFTGWFKVVKNFVASGNPFNLKFTAFGEPATPPPPGTLSLPPFLMLDNIKIQPSNPPVPPIPPATVPGPLPILGLGAAFACTRRLRRRSIGANGVKGHGSTVIKNEHFTR